MASNAQAMLQAQQENEYKRRAVIANAIKMKQQIFSQTIDPASQNVINVTGNSIRNVGLLLGFVVEVSGAIESLATQATRTEFGAANMVNQIRFDDLSNYTRIQVPGWYLATLNTIRQGYGYGGVYANNIPMGYGVNYDVYDGPATIGADTTEAVKMQYFVPISYSSTDLRGAIWMSTVSATSNLQITLNPNPVGTVANNKINFVYTNTAGGGGWDGPVTVTVYQVYLDQIPRMPNGAPILPDIDLSTVYDLKQTTFSTPTQGQDFPMAYSNYRSFLSTVAVFDNGGSYANDNVNYWALQAANFTNIWKVSSSIAALDARMTLMTDMPLGSTFFDSRDIPINTINYGNQELVLNASNAAGNARVLVGYESFAFINQLTGASSLGGG